MVHLQKWAFVALGLAPLIACEGNPLPPPDPDDPSTPPGAIAITSPIGDKMATRRSVHLTADPGATTDPITWSSSDAEVAVVDQTGLTSGLQAGATTITATAGGQSGRYTMTVVDADLEGMGVLMEDPYLEALIASVQDEASIALETAIQQCKEGVSEGHINNLELCLVAAAASVASPAHPSDAPLTASVGLLIEHLKRLLNV